MGTGGRLLRRLRARVSDVPTGFAWVEDRRLAASGYLASRGQLEWLVGRGINAVVTLTPEPLPAEMVEGLPLSLTHIPMEDHQVPDVETLARGAEAVRKQLAEGRRVVVHCMAGEGRTGCVLAAYLIRENGMSAADALKTLRAIKPLFVERAQEQAIEDYAASLHRPGSR